MKIKIISPLKDKLFVTLGSSGYLFFSTELVDELGIKEGRWIILGQGENGNLYIKPVDKDNISAFKIYKRKNGKCSVFSINVKNVLKQFNIEVNKTQRYEIEGMEDGFYKTDLILE